MWSFKPRVMALATFTLCQTPCWVGIRPVINDARAGQQCGAGQKARLKVTLSLRNSSSTGVFALYASPGSTEHARCWSVMKISMFGLFIFSSELGGHEVRLERDRFYQNVVRGFVLLVAVMLDQLKNRTR